MEKENETFVSKLVHFDEDAIKHVLEGSGDKALFMADIESENPPFPKALGVRAMPSNGDETSYLVGYLPEDVCAKYFDLCRKKRCSLIVKINGIRCDLFSKNINEISIEVTVSWGYPAMDTNATNEMVEMILKQDGRLEKNSEELNEDTRYLMKLFGTSQPDFYNAFQNDTEYFDYPLGITDPSFERVRCFVITVEDLKKQRIKVDENYVVMVAPFGNDSSILLSTKIGEFSDDYAEEHFEDTIKKMAEVLNKLFSESGDITGVFIPIAQTLYPCTSSFRRDNFSNSLCFILPFDLNKIHDSNGVFSGPKAKANVQGIIKFVETIANSARKLVTKKE
jgi:hypothetical protein